MKPRIVWTVVAILFATAGASGAGPAPEAKKAFMNLKATYVSFEITQVGSQDFSAPKDSLSDMAYSVNKSLKFEMPLEMALPDSCPSGTPMEQAMEQGRCMGWSFSVPDDPGVVDQAMSGKMDLSKNPMFVPARYSVDDVIRSRYRDEASDAWATGTRTLKGSGSTFVAKSGMMLCDFKTMTCDLSGITFGTQLGESVTITTTSDVPGSEVQKQTQEPHLLVPQIPGEISAKLAGFPLTLPGPSTLAFSGPGEATGINGRPMVTFKMTVSSRPAGKPATPAK
jgi:hypothetical protein